MEKLRHYELDVYYRISTIIYDIYFIYKQIYIYALKIKE